jgi:hypothetical protein
MEVHLVIAQPWQTLGADVSWDFDDVPDVELNRAVAAGQDPRVFVAARKAETCEVPDTALDLQAGGGLATPSSRADPAPRESPDWEIQADGDEDLGLFGPARPELDDIRAGEDMSALAWAEDPGEWPPSDPWVRRGLHNLLTRMTEELDVAGRLGTDSTITIRVSDLDNVLTMAVSALYEADARCGQTEGMRGRHVELKAG